MARKGARVLDEPADGSASSAWRQAVQRARTGAPAAEEEAQAQAVARAERGDEADLRRLAGEAGRGRRAGEAGEAGDTGEQQPPADQPAEGRPRPATTFPRPRPTRRAEEDRKVVAPEPAAPRRRERRLPDDVQLELATAAGPRRAPRLQQRLAEATRDYERDRYQDALRILKPLAESAPGAAAVRELHGLTLYRLGRWRDAIRELTAFHGLSGSFDQHPVIADCRRALGQHRLVDQLWEDLRHASPSPEVLAEGRVVVAGSLAERGDLGAAVTLLEGHARPLARPRLHHLRTWYALGDLYERAGNLPRARELFRRVAGFDPTLFDVGDRLATLGS